MDGYACQIFQSVIIVFKKEKRFNLRGKIIWIRKQYLVLHLQINTAQSKVVVNYVLFLSAFLTCAQPADEYRQNIVMS